VVEAADCGAGACHHKDFSIGERHLNSYSLGSIPRWRASTQINTRGSFGSLFRVPLKEKNMRALTIHHNKLQAVTIGGAPWFGLRNILRATRSWPILFRRRLLALAGLRKFLQTSDKPQACASLARVNLRYPWCGELYGKGHLAHYLKTVDFIEEIGLMG
jgi:hypothetical protein